MKNLEETEDVHHADIEESREKYLAALRLVSLKYEKFSTQTALALHELKTGINSRKRARRKNPKVPKGSNQADVRVNDQNFPASPELYLPAGSYFPPEIPPVACLNGLIGRCSKPFVKQLTESDVKVSQCRLSLHKINVLEAVLPLLNDKEDSNKGIPVRIYDANGKEYPMTFITWSSKIHVLKEGWINFCNDHSLLAYQDFLTLWVFRNLQTGDLCFVITSRRLPVFEAVKRRKLN